MLAQLLLELKVLVAESSLVLKQVKPLSYGRHIDTPTGKRLRAQLLVFQASNGRTANFPGFLIWCFMKAAELVVPG